MGLFGSSKKTIVFSQAAHLMEVNNNVNEDAVLYAVLRGESIANRIVNTHLTGIGTKMGAALAYAKDHYVLGLPNTYHNTSQTVSDSVLATTISNSENLTYGCIIIRNYRATMSAVVAAYPFLIDNRGYIDGTEEITTDVPGWVLPTSWEGKVISILKEVDYVEELTPTTVSVHYTAQISYREKSADGIWYTYKVSATDFTSTFTETITIPAGLIMQRQYYVACYNVLDSLGVADTQNQWWYYSLDSGSIPILDTTIGDGTANDSYPVIPIRYQNQYISESNSPEVYRTGSELLRRMNMSFDDLVTSLDTNPDIADIDNAYVTFGVDVQEDDVVGLRYLVEFFTWLAQSDKDQVWDNLSGEDYSKANYYSTGSYSNISGVTDSTYGTSKIINPSSFMSITEHGLRTQVEYQSITSYLVRGSIGDVGHATKDIVVGESVTYTTQEEGHGGDMKTKYHTRPGVHTLTLRYQLSVNTYRQVTVIDLTHHNDVYRNHGVTTTLQDVAEDSDEHNMIIPLHQGVIKGMSLPDRNKLYEGSIILSITGYDRIKLKWYQTGIFRALIMVVGFAISVYSGQVWATALIAAATAGVTALLMFLLQSVIMSAAIQYLSRVIAEEVGPELAMLVALVAMAAGSKMGGSFQMLGTTVPTAQALLLTSSALMSGSLYEQQQLVKAVGVEQEVFNEEAEEQLDELDKKVNELFPENLLTFDYVDAVLRAEPNVEVSPAIFYDLSLIENIGDLAISMVDDYVDVSLDLPEPTIKRIT